MLIRRNWWQINIWCYVNVAKREDGTWVRPTCLCRDGGLMLGGGMLQSIIYYNMIMHLPTTWKVFRMWWQDISSHAIRPQLRLGSTQLLVRTVCIQQNRVQRWNAFNNGDWNINAGPTPLNWTLCYIISITKRWGRNVIMGTKNLFDCGHDV